MGNSSWETQSILQASHDWLWVPPGVESINLGWARALVSERSRTLFVAWVNSAFDADATYSKVLDIARARRFKAIKWTVSSATRPTDLESLLTSRGAELRETTKILALELTSFEPSHIDVPPCSSWSVVDTPEKWDQAEGIAREVWNSDSPTPEERTLAHAELKLSNRQRNEFQVLSSIDGTPAGTGGVTLVGAVARLWGACTHPQFRGQGAYRATVQGRLATAREIGCTLALSNAMSDTSAPTLQSLGFTDYGSKRTLISEV